MASEAYQYISVGANASIIIIRNMLTNKTNHHEVSFQTTYLNLFIILFGKCLAFLIFINKLLSIN